MKTNSERLIQCVLCANDPAACGCSEKDEDKEGMCLKYVDKQKLWRYENMRLTEYNKMKEHKCLICGREVFSYDPYYTVSTKRKTKTIFHAECFGKEIAKNATSEN